MLKLAKLTPSNAGYYVEKISESLRASQITPVEFGLGLIRRLIPEIQALEQVHSRSYGRTLILLNEAKAVLEAGRTMNSARNLRWSKQMYPALKQVVQDAACYSRSPSSHE